GGGPGTVGAQRPEHRALPVVPDPRPRHVGEHGPRRIEEDLTPVPVPLLGDAEVVLDAVVLEVADAPRRPPRRGKPRGRRTPAPGRRRPGGCPKGWPGGARWPASG